MQFLISWRNAHTQCRTLCGRDPTSKAFNRLQNLHRFRGHYESELIGRHARAFVDWIQKMPSVLPPQSWKGGPPVATALGKCR